MKVYLYLLIAVGVFVAALIIESEWQNAKMMRQMEEHHECEDRFIETGEFTYSEIMAICEHKRG